LTSDVCTGIEIVKKDAIKDFKVLAGDLQKQFGTDAVRNAVHGSSGLQNKKAESDLFFSSQNPTTAFFTNCTCAIIKPHVLKAGQAGKVIDAILEEGFEISAMQLFNLDTPTAQEFFEIYRGVLPEFIAMTDHMTTGPCLVLEVR
jgi:nucleoside-diphosphate kinase